MKGQDHKITTPGEPTAGLAGLPHIILPSMILSLEASNGPAFGPAQQEVQQGANEMEKEDHQHPNNLFSIRQTTVQDGVKKHPDPEHGSQQKKWRQEECKRQSKDSKHRKHKLVLPFIDFASTVHRFTRINPAPQHFAPINGC
jgi:hypothetical protein